MALLGLPGKYSCNTWLCRMTHHRHILLDNASLFPGDCFHRIPKEVHMIQPNGRNAAQARLHHIGGIQSSPKAYFHHSRIHLFAFKGRQSQRRAHFKRGRLQPFRGFQQAIAVQLHFFFADQPSVQADSLLVPLQKRRGV